MELIKKLFNVCNLLFSLAAIATLIWFHGYEYHAHYLRPHLTYLYVSFGFFIAQFLYRGYLSGSIKSYFRNNRLEYIIFALIIFDLITNGLLEWSFIKEFVEYSRIENHDHVYILSLHIIILIIVGVELGKATARSTIWKLSPPLLFILSFVVLIVIGTSLLMLPEMTVGEDSLPFIDALFTSISANCVTGLTVVDTATYFSFKGKILILILIQLGGLNIIGFATYFISNFKMSSIAKRHDHSIKEILHTDNLLKNKLLIRKVIFTSLLIEFIGTILLYNTWDSSLSFSDNGDKLFNSIFHSVSAFNNAGFTLFTDGFVHSGVSQLYSVHLIIAVLIVLGGIGFLTLEELFTPKKWLMIIGKKSKLSIQSKISLYSTFTLITLGTIFFYVFESNNTLDKMDGASSFITSFFQSITTRTAGFNTVVIGELSLTFLVIAIFLMFIGASSGSTGGGVKTSTITVLMFSIWKRKQKKNNFGNSFLTRTLVKKAISLVLYSLLVITISTFLLVLVEPNHSSLQLLFEEVSAFGTVGLSTGITSDLSDTGKAIIMSSMFIGRIGPLALAYSLITSKPIREENEDKGIMLG